MKKKCFKYSENHANCPKNFKFTRQIFGQNVQIMHDACYREELFIIKLGKVNKAGGAWRQKVFKPIKINTGIKHAKNTNTVAN